MLCAQGERRIPERPLEAQEDRPRLNADSQVGSRELGESLATLHDSRCPSDEQREAFRETLDRLTQKYSLDRVEVQKLAENIVPNDHTTEERPFFGELRRHDDVHAFACDLRCAMQEKLIEEQQRARTEGREPDLRGVSPQTVLEWGLAKDPRSHGSEPREPDPRWDDKFLFSKNVVDAYRESLESERKSEEKKQRDDRETDLTFAKERAYTELYLKKGSEVRDSFTDQSNRVRVLQEEIVMYRFYGGTPSHISVSRDDLGQIYVKWRGGVSGDYFDLLE